MVPPDKTSSVPPPYTTVLFAGATGGKVDGVEVRCVADGAPGQDIEHAAGVHNAVDLRAARADDLSAAADGGVDGGSTRLHQLKTAFGGQGGDCEAERADDFGAATADNGVEGGSTRLHQLDAAAADRRGVSGAVEADNFSDALAFGEAA